MKIRTYKRRVNNVLKWYMEKVTELTYGKIDIRTPAGQELARRILYDIQNKQRLAEPMVPEWSFPLEIKFHTKENNMYPDIIVSIPEEWSHNNLLYLDFDESWIKR